MNDWIYISNKISYKNYDEHIHVRKLNLKTAKYSYLTLYFWELNDIFEKIINDIKVKKE